MIIAAFLIQMQSIESITVYSTVNDHGSTVESGLKLLPESVTQTSNFTQGIAICGSINSVRLTGTNFLFAIGNSKIGTSTFLHMGAYESVFYFLFGNCIIKDPVTNSFQIWSTNRWHHICISFDRNTHHLMLVIDGMMTNINVETVDLALPHLNELVTTEFYAGPSWEDWEGPAKKVASMNIWDRALTWKEAEDWTACKY